MAQYWYKEDKRILRISEDDISKDAIKRVKELKADGYVRVLDRRKPKSSIIEQAKPKAKAKTKAKAKAKSKAKKK